RATQPHLVKDRPRIFEASRRAVAAPLQRAQLRDQPRDPRVEGGVAEAHEEDVALLRVARIEHRDRVRLVEAGQEEEVRVLAELVVHVAVARDLARSGDEGETVAERLREAPAPL